MAFMAPILAYLGIAGSTAAATAGSAGLAVADTAVGAGLAATSTGTVAASSLAGTAAAGSSFLADASLAAIALGGVTGALGAYTSARAQSSAAKYQSELAAQNAQVEKENAAISGQAGAQQAGMKGQQTKAAVGEFLASKGASNIDVNTGSAKDVTLSQKELGELDALTIRSNAVRDAFSHEQRAKSLQEESALDKFEAEGASEAGLIGAGSTLLGAAGSGAMNFAKYQLDSGFTG